MTSIAFPFRTLQRDVVENGGWNFIDSNDLPVQLGNTLSGWDYLSRLELKRKLSIDFQEAAENLLIPAEELILKVIVSYGTGTGRVPRLRQYEQNKQLTLAESEAELTLKPESRLTSKRLSLETLIVLGKTPINCHDLAPSQPGSILWSDQLDVSMDSQRDRFPMEAVSFKKYYQGLDFEQALWYLCWYDNDLHREVANGVRLYLNSDNLDFIEKIEQADPVLLQVILADVMHQICKRFLDSGSHVDWYSDASEFSLARQALSWIEMAFENQSLDTVRERMVKKPEFFTAALMSIAEQ